MAETEKVKHGKVSDTPERKGSGTFINYAEPTSKDSQDTDSHFTTQLVGGRSKDYMRLYYQVNSDEC